MKRFSLLISLAAGLTLLATSSVQARYGDYYERKRTPLVKFDGTIAQAVVANPFGNLEILLEAVLAADPAILEALSNPDANLTVFAPVDTAFEAVPIEILDPILMNETLVTNVLLLHVVDGRFDPRKVFYIKRKQSLLQQSLFVRRGSSNPLVNQSDIECQGVKTDNGIVWLMNSVLMPQYLPSS